jgi:hypothetical protein
MARSTFFSFHYQRDIWRVNQVRNSNSFSGVAAAGWRDASLWEEAKKKGAAAIKKMIDEALVGTSVTVVCLGAETASREYVDYEIEQSDKRGNAIIGLRINHLKNQDGKTDATYTVPKRLTELGAKIYTFTSTEDLGHWVEAAAKAAGK